jgi:Sec-independent protein translocase protein TatA
MDIFGVGPLELLLIVGLGLVLFGPEELVRMARQAGRMYAKIRRATDEITGEVRRGLQIDDNPPPSAPPRSPVVRPVSPTGSSPEGGAARDRRAPGGDGAIRGETGGG